MDPTSNPIAASGNVLSEVAVSDPMLFCYGVAAVLLVLFWSVGVLMFGKPKKATDRPDRASWQPKPEPTTGPQLQVR
jgi:hypothetical protein